MAYSTQRITSNGTLVLLDIALEYFDRTEITVFRDGVLSSAWAWVGSTDKKISFSPAVPNGVEIMVLRSTDLAALRHEFSGGAQFTSESIDEALLQVLHIAQEAKENSSISDMYNQLNMHGYKIVNVGVGVSSTDAVTMGQMGAHDTTVIGYRDAAAASATAAANSAVLAAQNAASVDTSNFPTKTGAGATGTWNINILGTAGSLVSGNVYSMVGLTVNGTLNSAGATSSAHKFYSADVLRGAIWADTAGVGFLNKYSQWAMRVNFADNSVDFEGVPGVRINGSNVITAATLPAVPVSSVGGYTGAITTAQVASAASAGYGYTPANPATLASYMPKDFNAGNWPIGCMTMVSTSIVSTGAGTTTSGVYDQSGNYLPGSWRNLGVTAAGGVLFLAQRVA